MSSWKQYGGLNKGSKANEVTTDSLIVNNLLIKQPYKGNLIINGSVDINNSINIDGQTTFNGCIIANSSSIFNGPVFFNNNFSINGSISASENISASNNITCGNILYFNNNSQYIHGDSSGIGFNTQDPNAALDISTNLVNGIKIQTSQLESTSTLVQNTNNQGILLYGNTTLEYIDFFNETPLNSESKGDARLAYHKGGIFEIDVSQNINLLSNITISNRGSQPHLFNETAIIYDTSNGPFFDNIHSDPITTGSALSLISSNNDSNTFLNITTPSGEGLTIGGGIYSNDHLRSSGFIGLIDSCGNMINSGIIVSGSDPVKYKSTIGINTFQPQTEKYIIDINGPIHINNSDITVINQSILWQITSMSISPNRNKIIALGSSIDSSIVSGSNYRERIIISNDYGSTWEQIDISNQILQGKADKFTSIYVYDNSYAFLTGSINTIFFSFDGGYIWKNISTNIIQNFQIFDHIIIGNSQIIGNNKLYFSIGSNLYYSDFSFQILVQNANPSLNMSFIDTSLNSISDITLNNNSIFLIGGATILIYDINNLSNLPIIHTNSIGGNYNSIHCYENTIIAVGNNIISSSTNGGNNIIDTIFSNIEFNSIFCNDLSNAIAVGSQGNLWITQNGGDSWSLMPDSLFNISGKNLLVTDPSNTLQTVVMSDPNTIIISNTIVPYIQGSQKGSSELINIFIPNFINRISNNILDLCGNMQISGDLCINDAGSLKTNNETMSIFDTSVQTITIGANTNSIILGGVSTGITQIKHNMIVEQDAVFNKNMIISLDTLLNGELAVSGNTYINGYSNFLSDASFSENVIVHKDLKVYGTIEGTNDLSINGITTLDGNINIKGYSHFFSDASFAGNIMINRNLNVNGSINGISDLSINGITYLDGNINIKGYSHFFSDASFAGNIMINRNLTVNQSINGMSDLSLNGNLSIGGYSKFLSDVSFTGNIMVNQNLTANGSINGMSDLSLNGNMTISGSTNFLSDVSCSGNILVNRNLTVNNTIIGMSDLSLNGNLSVNNVFINKNLTVNSTSNFIGNVNISHDSYIATNNIIPNNINERLYIGRSINNSVPVTIQLGNEGDIIEINGTTVQNAPQINIAKTIVVNSDALGYASSAGSGLNIFDNSGTLPNYIPNNAGFIHVSNDLQSFVFKAPNINNVGNPISGNTILRLGVNSLTLPPNTNIINGLVVIQSDETYKSTQIANGTDFGVYEGDANYSIVSANFDISNIMIKDIDSIPGSQSISTNLIIYGNILTNGNAVFNSDSSFIGNLFANKNMIINGSSTFISDSSFIGNVFINRDAYINGNLIGIFDTSLNGNLQIGRNIIIHGGSTFISDSSFNMNVFISRDARINGKLIGLFDTSLNGNLQIGRNMVVNGSSTFISDSSFIGNIFINRDTRINGNIIGLYDISLNGNLRIGRNITVNGTSTFITDSSFIGNVFINRDIRINGNIIGLFDTSLNGNLRIGRNITVNGTSTFISDSSFIGNLFANKDAIISGNIIGLFDTSLNRNLQIGENITVNGSSAFISDSAFNGSVNINSLVNSTNSNTGSLVVNGGAGFNGNVWINGNIFADNLNQVIWNSQSYSQLYSNTYYLLATMQDFSNNLGSINITGSIGGQDGTNMSVINATVITSGNVATPTIIGTIGNYNTTNSALCDIVICYDNTSNNYQPLQKITDISGFIYDSSTIFYNTSITNIDINKIITGPGISENAIINTFDNSNNFSINTISNNLNATLIDTSSIGLILDSNTFIIQRNDISAGYFVNTSEYINKYSKPYISNRSGFEYSTPLNDLFNVNAPTSLNGFIQNRGGISYLHIPSATNLTGNILYKSGDILNAPILDLSSSNGYGFTYKLLLSNGTASLQNNSPNTTFYGYTKTNTLFLITNRNDLSVTNYITDNSFGTYIADGTTIGEIKTNFLYGLISTVMPIANQSFNVSGGIHRVGTTTFFVYTSTDPSINNFISTSDLSYNIQELSCNFLRSKISNSNKYDICGTLITNSNLISTSRFGISGESVPYYIVDLSTIAIPLTNSNYQNFNITGARGGDIITFGGNTSLGKYDGFTITASGDYLADASNCRHYVKINNASFSGFDASNASATITTASNYSLGTNIPLSSTSGTIAVGQYISIPTINAYNKSSIRVRTFTSPNITLDSALNVPANTTIHFYTPDNKLNIIKTSNFTVNKGNELFNFTPINYSIYLPVTFNFYRPQNYSLFSITDTTNGLGIGPQYSIYLLTNKDGSNPKGYFNLSITGESNNNIIYPFTDISSNPSSDNIIIDSICDSLSTSNNSFQTKYNTISSISTIDFSSANVTNVVRPIITTFDGSNIQMTLNSSYASLTISDSNIISGTSIKVVIQCSVNQTGISNNLIFGLGYNFMNPLFTSIPLSLVTTTYIANITIPINQSGSLNFYIYANPVSSGTLNALYVKSISISKLDNFINGNMGIGTSSPQYTLDVNGIINTNSNIYATNIGINKTSVTSGYVLDVNGVVQANSYNALSDYRLKENIIPISDMNFSIDLLKPVYYTFKNSQKQDLGFLAHEVQSELPFLVNGNKDGENMQSINYNGFIALLVKEIQELKKEMKVLKEDIRELKK